MNDIHSSTRWTRKSLNGTINEVTRDGQRGFVIDVYHYQDGRYTTQITTSDGVRTEEKIDNLDYYMMRASHRPMFDTQAEAEAHIEYAAQHPELLAFGTIAFPEYALWTPESLARAHAHRKQREQEQAERDARRAQQRTAPELVACDCGHTIDRDLVMRASMGSSCPDCYDRMSN